MGRTSASNSGGSGAAALPGGGGSGAALPDSADTSSAVESLASAIAARGSPFAITTAPSSVRFELRPPTVASADLKSLNDAVSHAAAGSAARPPAPPKGPLRAFSVALIAPDSAAATAAAAAPVPAELCQMRYLQDAGVFEIRVRDVSRPSPPTLAAASAASAATSATPPPSATTHVSTGTAHLSPTLDTLEAIALDQCVARHLTEGGDDRLHLHPTTGANKYYCKPYPPDAATVLRSSCTCSPPTREGFAAARAVLQEVWAGDVTLPQAFTNVRIRILDALGLSTVANRVVLHPSGSDAELVPLMVACARARARSGGAPGKVVSIVTAAGEVGSGTAPAAGGLHFSDYAPLGARLATGGMVENFRDGMVEVVELKPRADDGSLCRNYDRMVEEAVAHHLAREPDTVFVLHAVDGSKTGLRVPSFELIKKMVDTLGKNVVVVLDACQLRSKKGELQQFLDLGAMLLVTSSKFFSAPGFCGAVILPNDVAEELASCAHIPVGMGDYLTKLEVPPSIKALHRALPPGPTNLGLLLRWTCGLVEMEAFAKTPGTCDAASRWVESVHKLVQARRPFLELLDESSAAPAGASPTRVGRCNTIVSVKCFLPAQDRYLTADELRKLHRLMVTKHTAQRMPSLMVSPPESEILDISCFIGQPVKLGSHGVLRLALSAPLARKLAASPSALATALNDDDKVLRKLELLVKYHEHAAAAKL